MTDMLEEIRLRKCSPPIALLRDKSMLGEAAPRTIRSIFSLTLALYFFLGLPSNFVNKLHPLGYPPSGFFYIRFAKGNRHIRCGNTFSCQLLQL